jgi:membrane protease YdiL (CAAX protease family)
MSPGIGTRFRRLPFCDRLLLLVIGGWSIFGLLDNYFVRHDPTYGGGPFRGLSSIFIWAAIAGTIAYSLIWQQRRPATYGISFNLGGVASLAVLAVIHVYLLISGKFVLSPTDSFVWGAVGAFMEELAFRAIAIDRFILLMEGVENKVFWAILASSALWSVPHITSKSLSQLVGGIFIGGLFFGYVYYKSRSILLTAWIHGVANVGYPGGVLIAALYCVISFADWTIWTWNKPKQGLR